MRKARFMVYMKDPPGNMKHSKWRSITPVRQTDFPASLFLLPMQSFFVFFFFKRRFMDVGVFIACMSENIFIFSSCF